MTAKRAIEILGRCQEWKRLNEYPRTTEDVAIDKLIEISKEKYGRRKL